MQLVQATIRTLFAVMGYNVKINLFEGTMLLSASLFQVPFNVILDF